MIMIALLRCLLLVVLVSTPALAQQAAPLGDPADEVTEGAFDGAPTSFTVGLQGGLPGYRIGSAVAAVRAEGFGVALRLGYGTVGLSGGLQARWYPPLPLPLPAYLATGVDLYAGNSAWHVAIGAHVPLSARVRLDVEGGAARATTLLGASWSPYASLGVSYAIPVDVDAEPGAGAAASRSSGSGTRCDAPPDPGAVRAGVDAAARAFVRDGMALYGASYRQLTYRYRLADVQVDGAEARARVEYEGSALEVLTRNRVEASGVATVVLRWQGCRWVATSIDY